MPLKTSKRQLRISETQVSRPDHHYFKKEIIMNPFTIIDEYAANIADIKSEAHGELFLFMCKSYAALRVIAAAIPDDRRAVCADPITDMLSINITLKEKTLGLNLETNEMVEMLEYAKTAVDKVQDALNNLQ